MSVIPDPVIPEIDDESHGGLIVGATIIGLAGILGFILGVVARSIFGG